jgi:hypothetical protein
MSRIKRKSISGAPTEIGTAAPAQQSLSELVRVSFEAQAQANFPEEYSDADARTVMWAQYMAGVYTGAKLLSDSCSLFTKGAFEAHGAAVQAAKAPPITA